MFKNAIFYGIQLKTFYDGNGDGVGDFVGLTKKLDYIASLGVTCLWLLPFYPSKERDNGYDVMDYYNRNEKISSISLNRFGYRWFYVDQS